MPDELANEAGLLAFAMFLLVACVATWLYLLVRWVRRGSLLDYEPRRPVPWGPLGAALAVFFVGVVILWPPQLDEAEHPPEPNPLEVSQRIVSLIVFQFGVVGGFVALVAATSGAGLRDLGLPEYANDLARDVWIGILACLAALAPVYAIHVLLRYLTGQFDAPSDHPLIEMVLREQHVGVLLVASMAAVIAAPIAEEITFRLLLQGWLEKWEVGSDGGGMTNDEMALEQQIVVDSPLPSDGPAPRGVAGLPRGWIPILVSSLLFAAAHYGYGPEPVPLFFLALVLGYVYQRTHRIIPCIVAHALFNLVSVAMLWQMVLPNIE